MEKVDLFNQSEVELKETLSKLQREQFKLKLVKASGEMKKTHEIRQVRRNIARIKTRQAQLNAKKGDK